ncbi:hypothetical protein C2E31_23295 [Rhodopirellula baltica]|nr:hypothetical protein C2E31_23295 [Rhodopirellula baltica]
MLPAFPTPVDPVNTHGLRNGFGYPRRLIAIAFALVCCYLSLVISSPTVASEPIPAESLDAVERSDQSQRIEFFESRIRPVLIEDCYECHSEDSDILQGGLRLDFADTTRNGGDSGTAIVPGDPDASLLVRAMKYEDSEMPPSGKLDARILHDFETWIRDGALDPRPTSEQIGSSDSRDKSGNGESADNQVDAATFWSFQSPVGSHQSIDQLIDGKLETAGLQRNGPASVRCCFDACRLICGACRPRQWKWNGF